MRGRDAFGSLTRMWRTDTPPHSKRQPFSSVRNAVAFGTQDRLAKQYDTHLIRAEYFGFRVKGSIGVMVAGMMGTLSGSA